MVSQWRQLKDKLSSTRVETQKWVDMQEKLNRFIAAFLKEISKRHKQLIDQFDAQATTPTQPSDDPATNTSNLDASVLNEDDMEGEILRGIGLIKKQLKQKLLENVNSKSSNKLGVMEMNTIGNDLTDHLNGFVAAMSQTDGEITSADVASDAILNLEARRDLSSKVESCINALNEIFSVASSASPEKALANPSPTKEKTVMSEEKLQANHYKINPFLGAISVVDTKAVKHANGDFMRAITPGSDYCWVAGTKEQRSEIRRKSVEPKSGSGNGEDESCLEFILRDARAVSGLTLRGGSIHITTHELAAGESNQHEDADNNTCADTADISTSTYQSAVTLPSGVTLETCDGETDTTAKAIGDVIQWSALIKKNSPEKFLKRPPVRFLFDLFKFIATSHPNIMPASIGSADWDTVGASKQAKLDFMNEIITFVSSKLSIPEVTSGNSIITGSDAELTNKLLQQLALVVYAAGNPSPSNPSKMPRQPSKALKHSLSAGGIVKTETIGAWPSHVRIALSRDGEDWSAYEDCDVDLADSQSEAFIKWSSSVISDARYVRVTPLAFRHSYIGSDDNIISKLSCALQVSIHSYMSAEATGDTSAAVASESAANQSSSILNVIDALIQGAANIIAMIEYFVHLEEFKKVKKQEETKRQMEGLANEKMALEQMLAKEKQVMSNEKQDLSDQLRTCMSQLQETQGLLAKEQALKKSIESDYESVVSERNELQNGYTERIDEISKLKNELLKMQAHFEKDRLQIEKLQAQVSEQDTQICTLQGSLDEEAMRKTSLEAEKDDLAQ
jgi:hypothetical protein